jgi:hypothetical protein
VLLHAALFLPDFRTVITPKDGGKARVARLDQAELPKDPAQSVAPVRLVRGSHGTSAIELSPKWRFESEDDGVPALKTLPVGKYTLQVTYDPQLGAQESGWKGKASTGSVDIEIRTKPVPTGGGAATGGGGASRPVPLPAPRPPIHGGGVM